MERIIDPVDVSLIAAELTPDKKLCNTNKGGNEIYIIDAFNSPETMREIGRLREICFRAEGGCSGKSMDIDEFDLMEKPYRQMIVWDPEMKIIAGGYRFILGSDVVLDEKGQPKLSSAHLFRFSDEFIKDYLPYTMELGRSFVSPDYQSSKAGSKSIYILDNLWDGIGGIYMKNKNIIYTFGKPTFHPSYDASCYALIDAFLKKHCGGKQGLIAPYELRETGLDERVAGLILDEEDFNADMRKLKLAVRKLGANLPPLVNSYAGIAPTLSYFGGAYNDELQNATEIGILVCFNEMVPDKRDRHMEPYIAHIAEKIKKRFPRAVDNVTQWASEKKWGSKDKLYHLFKRKKK